MEGSILHEEITMDWKVVMMTKSGMRENQDRKKKTQGLELAGGTSATSIGS